MKYSIQKLLAFVTVFAFLVVTVLPHTGEAKSSKGLRVGASVNSEVDLSYKDNENLPKGIRQAPGIEKRVNDGKGLPFGILKKILGDDDQPDDDSDDDDSDDDDTDDTEIQILNPNVDISDTTATISFETNIETKGSLKYGTNSDPDTMTTVDLTLASVHEIVLEGLSPETKYYVKINLTNDDESVDFESGTRSFTTDASPDEEVEIVVTDHEINVSGVDVTISLVTNVETKGKLIYSDSSDFASSTEVNLELSSSHEVVLGGLAEETTYYFKIELTNEDESASLQSDARTFTTEDLDTEGPNIMFLHVFDVETNSVNVIWITTESSDAKVWVSTESDVDTTVEPTIENFDSKFFHVFEVADLEAGTEYYLKVSSSDASNNTTFSETLTFTTDVE